jgi:hypothetical protein
VAGSKSTTVFQSLTTSEPEIEADTCVRAWVRVGWRVGASLCAA